MQSTENFRACPVNGCDANLDAEQLMCTAHTGLVSLPLKRTLARLYNKGRVRSGYEEALASAVEQVETRLRRGR